MTEPLALVYYEELMPGSQLLNRLQDLGYRVQAVSQGGQLTELARTEGPMLILADLGLSPEDVCALISALKSDPKTAHIPIVAFSDREDAGLWQIARQSGANLLATDSAVLSHLDQLLEQALHLE